MPLGKWTAPAPASIAFWMAAVSSAFASPTAPCERTSVAAPAGVAMTRRDAAEKMKERSRVMLFEEHCHGGFGGGRTTRWILTSEHRLVYPESMKTLPVFFFLLLLVMSLR